ncbi:MAG TPA: sugar-binding protein, partial [bacterium]
DNPALTSETYNLYVSQAPITNTTAAGVVRLDTRIPLGQGSWSHRPYTTDGSSKTYYYAMTVNRINATETSILNGVSNAGPLSNSTTPTMKAVYAPNFGTAFHLDGNLNEFRTLPYSTYIVRPEEVSGDAGETAKWNAQSLDINFEAFFVIDKQYLYCGALITDDDPTGGSGTGQAWEGDAFELFIGFYNSNKLSNLHTWGSVNANNEDWRISFMADGRTQSEGSYNYTFPGMAYRIQMNTSPKGYVVEAIIGLSSLSLGYLPSPGDFLPLRINVTDRDPALGDATRSLLAGIGGTTTNHENWFRPSCWGCLEVAGGMSLEQIHDSLLENPPNTGNPVLREQAILDLDDILKSDSSRTSQMVSMFYTSMIEKVNNEIKANVVKGASVWMMYNHGYIVKTPTVTFAFDLVDGYSSWSRQLPADLLKRIKVLFISHNHGDHYDASVVNAIINNGGYVVVPSENSYLGNVGMSPGQALTLSGLDIHAYNGLHGEMPSRIYEVNCPNGLRILFTGDNQTSETLPQVEDIDVLFLNAWVNDSGVGTPVAGMRNSLAKLKPKMMIPGHIQELGHDYKPGDPTGRVIYQWAFEVDDVPVDSKVQVMAWGERFIIEGADVSLPLQQSPQILRIADVPNDQGRQVRISWLR